MSAMSDALAGDDEVGASFGGALAEQLHRVGRLGHVVPGQRQRGDRMDLFAGKAQRLAARGQHRDVRAAFEDLVGEGSAGVDQVLAVVEDQEDLPRRQEVDELAGGLS